MTTEDKIKLVCEAMAGHPLHYQYDQDGPWTGYDCDFCGGSFAGEKEDFVHSPNCPVLVAKELLHDLP